MSRWLILLLVLPLVFARPSKYNVIYRYTNVTEPGPITYAFTLKFHEAIPVISPLVCLREAYGRHYPCADLSYCPHGKDTDIFVELSWTISYYNKRGIKLGYPTSRYWHFETTIITPEFLEHIAVNMRNSTLLWFDHPNVKTYISKSSACSFVVGAMLIIFLLGLMC